MYFGHDRLGRRSLVMYMSDNKQVMMIASTVDCIDIHPIELTDNDWIHFSANAYHSIVFRIFRELKMVFWWI